MVAQNCVHHEVLCPMKLTCTRVERSDKEVFPLRRYLSKVFSLSSQFQSLLINIAYSHRMGRVLDTLIIERIDRVSESNTFILSKDII